jgi:hypothetical protein
VTRALVAIAALLGAAACTVDAPSMIPIDVSIDARANFSLRQVKVEVAQAGQVVQSGTYDWARATNDLLHVAILLPPEISGEVVVDVAGTTIGDQPTQHDSHRLAVTPGQVAATVRIVLLPPQQAP